MIINHLFGERLPYNFLNHDNHAKVEKCTSTNKLFSPDNLMTSYTRSLWISSGFVPQEIIFNLRNIIRRPFNFFNVFGIYCRYSLHTNPKKIEIFFGKDLSNFISFGEYSLREKCGVQLFKIPIKSHYAFSYGEWDYNYFKVVVKETVGTRKKCYINQIMLYEDEDFDLISQTVEKELNEELEKIKKENYFLYQRERDDQLKEILDLYKPYDNGKIKEKEKEYLTTEEEYNKVFCIKDKEKIKERLAFQKKVNKIKNLLKNNSKENRRKGSTNYNSEGESFLSFDSESEDEHKKKPEERKEEIKIIPQSERRFDYYDWSRLHRNLEQINQQIYNFTNRNKCVCQRSKPAMEIVKKEKAEKEEKVEMDEFTRTLSKILYREDAKIKANKKKITV